MKTAIDWDSLRSKFGKKKSILAVYTEDRSKKLGEADFDLGKYANDPESNKDKLPLRNCETDPKAYIQILIKAKTIDSDSTPRRNTQNNMLNESTRSVVQLTANLGLQAIEEKNSEFDAREELERQQQQYEKQIQRLKEELDGLMTEVKHKKDQVIQIQNESMNNMVPYDKLMEERQTDILQYEKELKQLDQVQNGGGDSLYNSTFNESMVIKRVNDTP